MAEDIAKLFSQPGNNDSFDSFGCLVVSCVRYTRPDLLWVPALGVKKLVSK